MESFDARAQVAAWPASPNTLRSQSAGVARLPGLVLAMKSASAGARRRQMIPVRSRTIECSNDGGATEDERLRRRRE